jgi:hypothetical protein
MVYRLRVAVDDDAHLNASSSLHEGPLATGSETTAQAGRPRP